MGTDIGAFRGDCPLLGIGRVEGYDAESHSLFVRLPSWQMPFPARLLINGPCDGVRINQQPLPIQGTWGLVAFPFGDYRNAIWLGAYVNGTSTSSFAQSTDAINSSSAELDTQMQYQSHFSGFYELLDGSGNYYARFPEGTEVLVNSNNQPPTTYRHVVNASGARERVEYTNAYRVPNPPSQPYYLAVNHPSGASISISASGQTIITGPLVGDNPGTSAQIQMNIEGDILLQGSDSSGNVSIEQGQGGTLTLGQAVSLPATASTIIIDPSQNMTITCVGTFTIVANGTTVEIDTSGAVTVTAATTVDITAAAINLGASGKAVARLGDQVTVGDSTGTITSASATVFAQD